MKPFTKKQNVIFLFLSALFLIMTMIPVLFSNTAMYILQDFLETKVFHRSFDINEWGNTVNALIAFPIFFVIFVDSVIFLKFSDKSKIILLCFYAVLFLVCTGIVTSLTSYKDANSDLISELLLGKECYLSKSFWPTSWNYSTEIRTINTQLITAPLFLFTSDLHLIKTISVVLLIPFLPLCLYFLLNELRIKELWIKFLACLWIICPTSNLIWSFVHFGSYYIPHICLAFIFLGLFFGIIYNDYSKKRRTVYLVLFYFLAFILGLSGIRYLLYFEIPLTALYLWRQAKSCVEGKKAFNIKTFFLDDQKIKHSFLSLMLSGVGYVLNSLILPKFYSFYQYNTETFKTYGDPSLSKIFGDILTLFGYQNNVSVFTPAGIVNILTYVFIIFFIICLIKYLFTETNEKNKDFLLVSIILILFNCFVSTNTGYTERYIILPFVFIVPCTILFLKNNSISKFFRGILVLSFSVMVITSSFLTYEVKVCSKESETRLNLTKFIKENDYHYGYATFWNANVLTYLTDGKIELAHFGFPEKEEDFSYFHTYKWLTPERYYKDDFGNNEKIVFIVSKNEYNLDPSRHIFANGKQIFEDDYYYIFEYKDNKTFKESF